MLRVYSGGRFELRRSTAIALPRRVVVCVFAKPPVPGRTKTRLAAAIGDRQAAKLAEAMLCDVWSAVCRVSEVDSVLASAGGGSFPKALSDAVLWQQGDGDLGARLERMLRRGLSQADAAIAVGSDVPQLRAEHIRETVRELEHNEAVLGPSPDGGYYLLGVTRCPSGLLDGIPWSCERTFETTIARLGDHGFSVRTLQPLGDVDVVEDLRILSNGLPCGAATRAWLEQFVG